VTSSSVPSSLGFATPLAGFDYFSTEAHYRSLAGRIAVALGGFGVIVVTGDPPASALTLAPALREATGSRYEVFPFPYATELGGCDLPHLLDCACPTSLRHHGAIEEEPGSRAGAPLLVICDNTLRFSDEQLEEVFKAICDRRIGAAVLLTQSGFLARLERPALRFWLTKRLLVARLRFEELGPDEIAAFIRHQFGSGEGEGVFTAEAITAIASVSGGDPMVVNRFSRRLLDFAAATTGDRFGQAVAPTATEPMEIPSRKQGIAILGEPSIRMWRGGTLALKLSAGTVFCLACVAVAAVLLVRPTEEKIAGSNRSLTEAVVNVPDAGPSPAEDIRSQAGVAAGAETTLGSPPEMLPGSAPKLVPSAGTAPAGGPQQEAPALAAPLDGPTTPVPAASPAESVPTAAAVHSTGIPKETLAVPLAPAPPPRLSAAELAALRARGDRMFALGDISSARLFYERAADTGDGQAALNLAKTFDPVFLYSARLYWVRGDADRAAYWYRRARDLGAPEAR
jgi:hypothetical protein